MLDIPISDRNIRTYGLRFSESRSLSLSKLPAWIAVLGQSPMILLATSFRITPPMQFTDREAFLTD